MNCYDFATNDDLTQTAAGICHDCGGAVCIRHVTVAARYLTRTAVVNRVVEVAPPAR